MEISTIKPAIPISAIRAAHFHRLHDFYTLEVDGEPTTVLDAELLIKWLIKYKDDPELLGVIHDINANAGIAVNLLALKKGKTAIADLLVDNREPASGPIVFPLEAAADLLVHHQKHKQLHRRDLLIEFLKDVGLEPNLTRLVAERCTTCGK